MWIVVVGLIITVVTMPVYMVLDKNYAPWKFPIYLFFVVCGLVPAVCMFAAFTGVLMAKVCFFGILLFAFLTFVFWIAGKLGGTIVDVVMKINWVIYLLTSLFIWICTANDCIPKS